MPFKSSSQMRAAFGGYLGPEMKSKAEEWAHETPDIASLPEHVKQHARRTIAQHHDPMVRALAHHLLKGQA